MHSTRPTAIVAGVLFLVTEIAQSADASYTDRSWVTPAMGMALGVSTLLLLASPHHRWSVADLLIAR
ncbi:hypothetical protein [Diaminobutyricimonas sp. LJ205]|uniref:hypothetical protein n=1 Tax=Diaminobutyricimonas sp. LJ205 TaxID=2683590 RepID=UPI0012F4A1A7|nr:hypothetical protein [Diaminobutyricimonas sp. LJ205]